MSISRRYLLAQGLFWAAGAGCAMLLSSAARADSPIAPGGPDLQTTLEKGLRARRPVEFEFIASVVEMVDDGTLPASIVQTSFLWARRKRPYPFPYFKQSLIQQAKLIGVDL
jgi:hypothetical protein